MADYVTAATNLPRSLDVQISVSNPQTAVRTDLSTLCVACESIGLLPDANRIRFYSDLDSIINDFGTRGEPYRAAAAFFGQSPHPQQMAIGEVFLTPQPALLIGTVMSAMNITNLNAITAGNLVITITSGGNSVAYTLNALNFGSATTLALIASVIQAKLTTGNVPATCVVETYPGGNQQIVIATTATGNNVTISFPIDSTTGTFAGTALGMTAASGGSILAGYTPSLAATPGQLIAGVMSDANISALQAISAGNMELTIGGVSYNLNAMDFTNASTLALIAGVIQAKLTAGTVPATCSVEVFESASQQIVIQSTATGALVTMAYPVTTGTGTFVGTLLCMPALAGGQAINGSVPADISGELQNIQNAANAAGQFIFGWILEAKLREPAIQMSAATWALGQTNTAIMPILSNDLGAYDPSYNQDFMSLLASAQNMNIVPMWHDNPQQYPDVSILAYMLSVNYRLKDSTVSAKFKQLPGITPVAISLTQYLVLQGKGYNCYTNMGGGIDTYRQGLGGQSGWAMDTVINIANFVDDLGVNVFNAFLRNKKIPYTRAGQMLLVDPCKDTGEQYTYNGSFADRDTEDSTQKTGIVTIPAVQVIPTPIYMASSSDRVSHVGPPITMIVQDSGWIGSIAISVQLVT